MVSREELKPDESTQDPALISRRRFLSYASGVLSALIGFLLAVPLIRFYIGNTFTSSGERWLKIGDIKDIKLNQPNLFNAGHVKQDGWRQTMQQESVYVVRRPDNSYNVFSYTCTHLGCPVHWDDEVQLFLCPCHDGGFNIDGTVAKGPPPRPLDKLEHKIDNDILFVKIMES